MNVKSIIKKVSLGLAGVAALTAVGFGVKAIVDHTKQDLKTIMPSFEVGNLGSDGKFVDDKSTLYTKEAFGCYGLQVKPDFDSSVNYQIFYYDILDNYISSTSVLSDGYSGEAPVNGAYARMVIEPRNDEDGKISLTERVKYPGQLTVKVKKEQDIENRFVNFKGKLMQVVSDTGSLAFTDKLSFNDKTFEWVAGAYDCVTSTTLLKVSGGSTISFSHTLFGGNASIGCSLKLFSGLPSQDKFLGSMALNESLVLDKKVEYAIICINYGSSFSMTEDILQKLPSCFKITK